MNFYKLNLQLFAEVVTNYTGDNTQSAGMSPEMKTYYEMKLLDNAEPLLIHDQFGEKKPIPEGKGKTIEFRRIASLPKALNRLMEGVTPEKSNMSVTSIQVTIDQYGDWIQSSDLLELTTIDPILDERTKVLGSQAGRTLDTVTREVINGGTNVIFADHKKSDGSVTRVNATENLQKGCNLTFDTIFRAAAQLKAQNAPKFGNKYVAIIHPYAAYDIMSSDKWIDVNKYSHTEQIYEGEIGSIAGVRFVETSEAKVFLPGEIAKGARRMTVKTAVSASTTSVVVNGEYTNDLGASNSNPIPVYVNGAANTVVGIAKGSGSTTLTLGTAVTSLAANAVICGVGGSKTGEAVFSTLVLGQGAYAVTELSGGGLQHIVKQLGYGDDPINQRSSSGWKATKAALILNDQYMVRIESVNDYSQLIDEN